MTEPQQKGEKMPTFEPTVKEIIAEMYKRFGHLLGAREIDEFARDFGRHPAASEERGLREVRPSFERWWMAEGIYLLPNVGEPPEHAAIAEAAFQAALRLQSVPSSLRPEGCICSEAYGVGPEQCGKHGSPSDAGQPCELCGGSGKFRDAHGNSEPCACVAPPSLEKLRELEAVAKKIAAIPLLQHSPERPIVEAIVSAEDMRELRAVLAELEPKVPPPSTCQEEQD